MPYNNYNFNVSIAGTYFSQLTTKEGCDSLVELQLVINRNYTFTYDEEICHVDLPFNKYGFNESQTGRYYQNYTTKNGCDSIIILNLKVKQEYHEVINETICSNELPYTGYGFNVSEAGRYKINYSSNIGCDSIVELILNVNPSHEIYITDTVCDSDMPYNRYGFNLFKSGTYSMTHQNVYGCDSTIHLTLEILEIDLPPVIDVCADDGVINVSYKLNMNLSTTYSVKFNDEAKRAGCKDVKSVPLKARGMFELPLPEKVRPNHYSMTIIFDSCHVSCREYYTEFVPQGIAT